MRQVKFGMIVLALVGSAAMAQAQRGGPERQSDERRSTVREWAPSAQRGSGDADRRAQFMERRAQIMERMHERRAEQGELGRAAPARPQGERFGARVSPEQDRNVRGPARPGLRGERGEQQERGAFRPELRRGGQGAVPGQGGEFRGERAQERRGQMQRPQMQRPQMQRPQGERPQGERPQGQRSQGQRADMQQPEGRRGQSPRLNADRAERRIGQGQVERRGRGLQAGPESGAQRGPAARLQDSRGAAPRDREVLLKRRSENGSNGRL